MNLFAKPKIPTPPAIKPPEPLPNDTDIQRQKMRMAAEQNARSGRQSTILTGNGNSIGL